MLDDTDTLEEILMNLNRALRKAVSNAAPAHSDYAVQLLDFTTQYATTTRARVAGRPGQLVWNPDPDAVRSLSRDVLDLVKGDEWERALEQSHVVLSVLPGEPGGIPRKPPKLPW